MEIAALLDQQLRTAGIPIIGVSVKDPADRSSWRVEFSREASPAQQKQAVTLLTTAVVDASALADAELSNRLNADQLFRATVIWIAGKVGATPAEARAEIIAIYRVLSSEAGAAPKVDAAAIAELSIEAGV